MAELKYLNDRGVVVADTAQTRSEVEASWRAAFGQELVVDPETPQGVIIALMALSLDHTARVQAETMNQFNPDLSTGLFLDGLMNLMGGERFPATRSTIPGVRLGGVPQTPIQAGSVMRTQSGDIFRTTSTVILNDQGEAFVDVRADEVGPIKVAPGELNQIAESVLGWETVHNGNAAVPGRFEESNARARNRRTNILAANTISVNEAIISGLYMLPDVHSLTYRENFTDAPITFDGVVVAPRTVYTCINGGVGEDIARVMKDKKTLGAGFTGTEEVTIIDEFSGQPYPVRFDRPTAIDVFCRVTVAPSANDAQSVVRTAIEIMESGEIPGEPGFVVGRDLSPFEIASAINYIEPTLFVRKVELSTDGVTWNSSELAVRLNEIVSLPTTAVVVIVQ